MTEVYKHGVTNVLVTVNMVICSGVGEAQETSPYNHAQF